MITRTTLKTLWLAGGGVLATWLAVSPHQGVPTTSPVATTPRPSAVGELSADELSSQAEKLRSRTSAITLRQSTRNPFRFNAPKSGGRDGARGDSQGSAPASAPPALTAPAAPLLTLSGVAEKKTPDGAQRTAILSGGGQIYLAGVGDAVAGRYTVVAVDPEAVVLRDASGTELRLILRP